MTKVLSKKDATPEARAGLSERISTFRNDFKQDAQPYLPSQIFNTDQSGFNDELLSKRTLETKGTKVIYSTIRSTNSATHSYTVQFLITAAGELKAPLFIILRESKGEFGERVARTMFRHPELHVVASSSGKITKVLLKDWFKNVYFPNADDDSLLLLDSLTTYNDRQDIDNEKPSHQDYIVVTIPGGLTGFTQPLDVYFNRPYKSFFRRISDYINFHYFETIKLHVRDTILKLHTMVHNQFRSPRFQRFIQHAWKKSGLRDGNEDNDEDVAPRFDDPNGFCFDPLLTINSCCAECDRKSCFIRCNWCKKFFCFDHFFLNGEIGFHFCEEFIL